MQAQPEAARERADYADRIRRQNERLAYCVAAFLVITAAPPVTSDHDRVGVLLASLLVLVGGDEFLILLPGTGLAQAILVVERLRAAVREARWGEPDAIVTVSSGIAQWTDGQSGEAMLQSADRSL